MATLALAILFQGLLPTGFMPSAADGKIALTICSGTGEKTVFVDQADHDPSTAKHQPGKAHTQICPYALAHAPGTLPLHTVIASFLILLTALQDEKISFFAAHTPLTLPPSRGPPSIAG